MDPPSHGDAQTVAIVERYPGIDQFLALRRDGQFGWIDSDDRFTVEEGVSNVYRAYGRSVLAALSERPEDADLVPAVLLPAVESLPWETATLVINDAVVRRIQPGSGGRGVEQLTSFQMRNRYRSIFQGMEALLRYRSASLPTVPVYCPLLLAARFPLQSLPNFGETVDEVYPGVSEVVAVINLLSGLPPRAREDDRILKLIAFISARAIHRHDRRRPQFDIDSISIEGDRYRDA